MPKSIFCFDPLSIKCGPEARRLRAKFPDMVPIVCLFDTDHKSVQKLLVPTETPLHEVVMELRTRLLEMVNLTQYHAINMTSSKDLDLRKSVWSFFQKHRSDDGLLHLRIFRKLTGTRIEVMEPAEKSNDEVAVIGMRGGSFDHHRESPGFDNLKK